MQFAEAVLPLRILIAWRKHGISFKFAWFFVHGEKRQQGLSTMSIKIGDPIFEKNGFPAFVKERDPEVQSIKLDSAPEKVRKNSRHGYIRGLAEDQRADFNNIMDDIREIEDPQKSSQFTGKNFGSRKF